MATFLDRRALKKILDAATAIRKMEDGRAAEQDVTIYLVRGEKRKGRPLLALQSLHSAATEAFGGHVVRETPEGLLATFGAPIDALRAGLHALHSVDLAADLVEVLASRVAIVQGRATAVERPFRDVSGPAVEHAGRIIGRAAPGEVAIEESLYASVRAQIEGYADIEVAQPRRGKIPGLGVVTTLTLRPIGLRPEREVELLDVDSELRARARR